MVKDVLTRLQLPINNLRSQTYDGASNMAGLYNGCQAFIKQEQPLASYIHCGAHISHLITSKAIESASFIRDALNSIQELGNLYNSSGKFKHMYLSLSSSDKPDPKRLKPICQTRWLTRGKAVSSALNNYPEIISALEKASDEFGTSTSSRASGIRTSLISGKCILGLLSSQPFIMCMEMLNKSLQTTSMTVSGMLALTSVTKGQLMDMRSDTVFHDIFNTAHQKIGEWNCEDLKEPRRRKIPRRVDEGFAQDLNEPITLEARFKQQF